jgi:cytochrome c oxidase subunit 2
VTFGRKKETGKQMKQVMLLVLTLFAMSTATADQAAYAVCAACHGANGEGNVALNGPALAGQEAWYVERQLKNFKAGIRGSHKDDIFGMQMRPMASMLTDDAAVTKMANYIASMPPAELTATVEGNAEAGKALYAVCAACHGTDAKGLKAMNGPSLVLQQDWYTVRQLKNFKSGIRGSDSKDLFGMQMKPMASMLTSDQAIKDLAAYLNSL